MSLSPSHRRPSVPPTLDDNVSYSYEDVQMDATPVIKTCIRTSLKHAVKERRASLTVIEKYFLQDMCATGSEADVQKAYRKLMDEDLFDTATRATETRTDTNNNGAIAHQLPSDQSIPHVSSDDAESSSMRQERLQKRKSMGACQLWAAHESSGSPSSLLSSAPASRRSSLVPPASRRSSLVQQRQKHRASIQHKTTGIPSKRASLNLGAGGSSSKNWSKLRNVVLASGKIQQKLGRRHSSFSSVRSLKTMTKDDSQRQFLPATLDKQGQLIAEVPRPINQDDVADEEKKEDSSEEKEEERISCRRLLLARRASVNDYLGEGFEVGCVAEDDDGSQPSNSSGFLDGDDNDYDYGEGENATKAFLKSRGNFRSSMHFREHGLNLLQKPVLMRFDESEIGEGMEIADWEDERPTLAVQSPHHGEEGREGAADDEDAPFPCSSSFDETMSFARVSRHFEQDSTRRIHRCDSDDALFKRYGEKLEASIGFLWHIENYDHYDSWLIIEEEGTDEVGASLPFRILGTSAHDSDCHPHVLSPQLMESLQPFIPFSKQGESLWLKYSLVRDGASLQTFLQHARSPEFTFLAIETVDGEVFGSFTAQPWRKSGTNFGIGGASFLWRMRGSRADKCWSIAEQARKESEVDVFSFYGGDPAVQLCTSERLVVGGMGQALPGTHTLRDGTYIQDHEWGFGLAMEQDLLRGTSSPCVSFCSPSLSKAHSDGSIFEIINLELWTCTPCLSQVEAERMEVKKLFLDQQSWQST